MRLEFGRNPDTELRYTNLMSAPNSKIAEFDLPPVVEVAIGLEFEPLTGWGIPHFGLFWKTLREQYPTFKTLEALPSHIERFGAAGQRPRLALRLVRGADDARCWFEKADGTRLLQVQRNRFIINWRKTNGSSDYPQYENLEPEFKTAWKQFLSFLVQAELPTPKIRQCEITYVNIFPEGVGWSSAAELQKVTPLVAQSSLPGFELESASVTQQYLLPDNSGRLHLVLQPVLKNDGARAMRLDITARGAPRDTNLEAAMHWFGIGHKSAVSLFLGVTTPAMHKTWKRTL